MPLPYAEKPSSLQGLLRCGILSLLVRRPRDARVVLSDFRRVVQRLGRRGIFESAWVVPVWKGRSRTVAHWTKSEYCDFGRGRDGGNPVFATHFFGGTLILLSITAGRVVAVHHVVASVR